MKHMGNSSRVLYLAIHSALKNVCFVRTHVFSLFCSLQL